ncbi:DUF1330 domain-containing protein [Thalassotalea sediminis]|uniref:DUF1330 domain-containing protein n=1 Tax=Thalassotalea sediminis TaxID=1759089 RepID=UPI00257297B6|nr:DUF1330 domain-containing protein [Thalassotalea sediminis]
MKLFSTFIFSTALLSYSATTSAFNQDSIKLSFEKNEMLSLLLLDRKHGGEAAQQAYFKKIAQLTKPNDVREVILMPVTQTLAGDHPAEFFALYAWKSDNVAQQLRENPLYKQDALPLQNQGWNELSFGDVDISVDEEYQLSPDKFYTVSELWITDQEKYQQYFEATKALRAELGAKFIFKQHPKNYGSIHKGSKVPSLIALIEWNSQEAIRQYPQAEAFKQAYPHLLASTDKFTWYQVSLPTTDDSY